MKTPATEMLQVEYPIFAFLHCRDVVAAVTGAGGFGVLGAVAPIPVLAAGGIATGRQMAASLALGAAGVWCGSVWLTTRESETPPAVKERMLAASSDDTVRTRSFTGKPCRVLRSEWTSAWEAPDAPDPLPMPLPSMLSDRPRRRVEAVAERFPGVWCHGDWVTFSAHGTCQVTGRSDATLNRGGVRLGPSEFYAVIDEIQEIADSLVVHLEDANGGSGQLILFVVTRDGAGLTGEAAARIRSLLREQLSPRHQPDLVRQVAAIPRTLTGKRMEVPVKRVLLDPGAVAPAEPGEPDVLAEFRDLGRQLAAPQEGAPRAA